jgi:hypothetical protein
MTQQGAGARPTLSTPLALVGLVGTRTTIALSIIPGLLATTDPAPSSGSGNRCGCGCGRC